MAVSSAATFQLLALPQAVCEFKTTPSFYKTRAANTGFSFAFVEYESRRDSDDAYHEMHNKRIGRDRDEQLKIEVRYHKIRS